MKSCPLCASENGTQECVGPGSRTLGYGVAYPRYTAVNRTNQISQHQYNSRNPLCEKPNHALMTHPHFRSWWMAPLALPRWSISWRSRFPHSEFHCAIKFTRTVSHFVSLTKRFWIYFWKASSLLGTWDQKTFHNVWTECSSGHQNEREEV